MNDQTKLLSRVGSCVERGERIGTDDCAALFEVGDLGALARLARVQRERRFGREAYYYAGGVLNYEERLSADAFRATLEEAITLEPCSGATVRFRTSRPRASALAVVDDRSHGQLLDRSLDGWCDRFATLALLAEGIVFNISPRFIDNLAADSSTTHAEVIGRLLAVAPLVISGDEGEIFDISLRSVEVPTALRSEEWIALHSAAHAAGVRTVAAMSYGTVDHPDAYAAHLDRLRSIQDEHAGFMAFLPMAIHNSDAEEFYLSAPTAVQTLRATAIARIALDNIPHILAAPSLVTLEVATVALSYGADTLDRTTAIGDVLATEPSVARRPPSLDALPIASSSIGTKSRFERSAPLRSQILEARWQPVAIDSFFERTANQGSHAPQSSPASHTN